MAANEITTDLPTLITVLLLLVATITAWVTVKMKATNNSSAITELKEKDENTDKRISSVERWRARRDGERSAREANRHDRVRSRSEESGSGPMDGADP